MDSMEVNKGGAAVLIAGIAFFLTGTLGDTLVHTTKPHVPAIKIEIAAPAVPAGAAPVALAPTSPLLASADVAAGEALAKKLCASCHTFNEGGKPGVGPNLYNTLGAARATHEGFAFSPALKGKPGNWGYEELSAWLFKPAAFAPGTRMAAFPGISSDKQRADVIAYLRGLSKTPVPLP